jgi:hypothetical protein
MGAVLTAAIAVADATVRSQKGSLTLMFVLSLAYGYGSVVETNALLDHSQATHYSAAVESKHISRGKHVSYKLKLAPWGPKTKDNELEVSKTIYDAIESSDTAVLSLRHGVLGINWYYLSAWQRGHEAQTNR